MAGDSTSRIPMVYSHPAVVPLAPSIEETGCLSSLSRPRLCGFSVNDLEGRDQYGQLGFSVNLQAHSTPPLSTMQSESQPKCGTSSLQLCRLDIQYTKAHVPDPPAISFVRDITRLDRLWDDSSPQWDDSSPLQIKGTSIALVYWPAIYRYDGTKRWTAIKQRWFEWKVSDLSFLLNAHSDSLFKSLIVEYRALGSSAFWAKYSTDNVPLPITKILHIMKNARLQEDLRMVELAKI
jgi:hypothetical protein